MAAAVNDPRVRYFLGDIRDRARLDRAMWGVDTVIHAAAMKRIEKCDDDPCEAVLTNIVGTHNVGQAAIDAGVRQGVLLSTDKSPSASTLYGGTKFVAERLWCQENVSAAGRVTRLSAVRYGNVLGSRGSVLDEWRAQAKAHLPVKLTDARCTRFWLTIEQAVDLVVLALNTMRGGETLIPKAPSSPILALAEAVAGVGCDFTESGLRPSERLHETLIASDEARTTFDCGTHYVIEPQSRTWGDVAPLVGRPVAPDFAYRSDTNPLQHDVEDLRLLIGEDS